MIDIQGVPKLNSPNSILGVVGEKVSQSTLLELNKFGT